MRQNNIRDIKGENNMFRRGFITKCSQSFSRKGGTTSLFECTGVLPLIITKIIIGKIEHCCNIRVAYGKIEDLGCQAT